MSGYRSCPNHGLCSIYQLFLAILVNIASQFLAVADVEPPFLPALQSWDLNVPEQQLSLQTVATTTPEYFLLSEPSRLVIDLSDTRWPEATLNRRYSDVIQQLRIGQVDEQTTRVVLTWTEKILPTWTPSFRPVPQVDNSVIWVFDLQGAIAWQGSETPSSPAFPIIFPPALLPPTAPIPLGVPPLRDLL